MRQAPETSVGVATLDSKADHAPCVSLPTSSPSSASTTASINAPPRVVLEEKGVCYETEEIDPFDPNEAERLRPLHQFGRVPVLRHGDFVIYETDAICRYYVADAFEGPALVPTNLRAAARLAQALSIWTPAITLHLEAKA